MEIKVMAFGKIADMVGRNKWNWEEIESVSALRERLEKDFPQLQGMRYQVAVNKKMVNAEVALEDQAEVALLPPYSGG